MAANEWDREGVRFMGPFILTAVPVAVLAVLLMAAALAFRAIRRKRRGTVLQSQKRQSFARRRETASHGSAVVIRADGGIPADGAAQARVSLTLEVTPPGGRAYRARTEWMVGLRALGYLQKNAEIAVRIDAEDAGIIYPEGEWAKYVSG
jgi:hypothetical protein